MSDTTEPSSNASGPRWVVIVGSVLVVVVAAVAAFVVFSGDDDDDDTTTTTTIASETTTPDTTAAPTTEAPTTTESPATTEAPTTTEPPATTEAPTTTVAPVDLEFTMADIDDGGQVPVEFSCDGENTPPIVTIVARPEGTAELAFIVDDPDAPTDDPFVHWVVYGIPGDTAEFTDGEDGLTYGVNDANLEEWFGPCPPPGDGPHEYVFTLFALDQKLVLDAGLDGRELAEAIAGAVIAEAEVTASYERAS